MNEMSLPQRAPRCARLQPAGTADTHHERFAFFFFAICSFFNNQSCAVATAVTDAANMTNQNLGKGGGRGEGIIGTRRARARA